MADARQQGATKVVTFGGLQSNHARLTAAAASLLGMEAHLLYFEPRPKVLTGNLLLNELLGARMHFFPLASKRPRPRSLETTIRLARLLARLRVGPHYFIPVGGHTWVGRPRLRAGRGRDRRAGAGPRRRRRVARRGRRLGGHARRPPRRPAPRRLAPPPPRASTSGSSGRPSPLPSRTSRPRCARTSASRTSSLRVTCRSSRRPTSARPTAGRPKPGNAALVRLARAEGILLDPVYTAKAFAGLLGEAAGRLGAGEPVVFVHTGGLPALFA